MSRPRVQPRPEVLALEPVHHGAFDYAELERLGLNPEDLLDFSVNGNPYGPSPLVRQALADVPLDRYPDREVLALRRALADHLGLSPDRIVVGNGTAELLVLLALAFVRPGDPILIVGPTFGEYERVSHLMGGRVETWAARAEQAFVARPTAIARRLRNLRPRLAFLCRPNNPTGHTLPLEAVAEWAQSCPQTLLVVDEAYLAFTAGCPSALETGAENVLVLRSMTKDYALAGLRLGYAVGAEGVISALARVRPPWNVNALAQAAGLAALADGEHSCRSLGRLLRDKGRLVAELEALGLTVPPSEVHFFLVRVRDAAATRAGLLSKGIVVRDCTSFGLPGFVRVATRRPEENERLVAAWRDLVKDRRKELE